jgi:hypothetical protein
MLFCHVDCFLCVLLFPDTTKIPFGSCQYFECLCEYVSSCLPCHKRHLLRTRDGGVILDEAMNSYGLQVLGPTNLRNIHGNVNTMTPSNSLTEKQSLLI